MNLFHIPFLAFAAVAFAHPPALRDGSTQVALQDDVKIRVPVELGVMSR